MHAPQIREWGRVWLPGWNSCCYLMPGRYGGREQGARRCGMVYEFDLRNDGGYPARLDRDQVTQIAVSCTTRSWRIGEWMSRFERTQVRASHQVFVSRSATRARNNDECHE